jgi:hypothetical protein
MLGLGLIADVLFDVTTREIGYPKARRLVARNPSLEQVGYEAESCMI